MIEVDDEASNLSDVPTSEHRDTSTINSPPLAQEQKRDTPDTRVWAAAAIGQAPCSLSSASP
jgi:hypothetical protein